MEVEMFDRRALVVGATGIVGANLVRELLAQGDWYVYGVSRKPVRGESRVTPVCVDVLDATAVRDTLKDLEPTHVFFCTWTRMKTEEENCRVNSAMVRNVLDGLADSGSLRHVALVTGTKHYLGPFESYAKNSPQTPFREDQPRLPIANFYYAQEDVVLEFAAQHDTSWSVHRPHTIVGHAVGNAMNIGVTLATYASVCRAQSRPFIFPGSTGAWRGLNDVTDARLLAKHLTWAATHPSARNEAFNVANGDVFRWSRLWDAVGAYFDLEAQPCPEAPLGLTQQMADMEPLWDELVRREGLQPNRLFHLASPWHTDLDLGRPMECLNDTNKSRRLGFLEWQDTERSFIDLFDQLRRERIIP
ncbi:SDR family oxidoreductase [Paraburkholderia terrae]|nr:SDR family oxidoreductase [Paraburkholderia terrae]